MPRRRSASASTICSPRPRSNSNLNPAAQAATSSAKGLYQFIDQTWLGTMKQAGAALGLSNYADAISKTPDGRYEVADPAMRSAIMKLRGDPATSAMLAGALDARQCQPAFGGDRPPADRRRALHRAFPGARRRRQADRRGLQPAARQCGRHVSAGRRRQSEHFLRPLRQCPQRQRRLCHADRTLRRRPRRRGRPGSARDRWPGGGCRGSARHRRHHAGLGRGERQPAAGRRTTGRCFSPCSATARAWPWPRR